MTGLESVKVARGKWVHSQALVISKGTSQRLRDSYLVYMTIKGSRKWLLSA